MKFNTKLCQQRESGIQRLDLIADSGQRRKKQQGNENRNIWLLLCELQQQSFVWFRFVQESIKRGRGKRTFRFDLAILNREDQNEENERKDVDFFL